MDKVYQIGVIGGGSAGVMASLRGVLNNDEVIMFTGSPKDRKKSRAFWVAKVENMPGHLEYKKGIVNPNDETLKWISESDFKDNFHLIKNRGITEIKKENEIFNLTDNKGETYKCQYLIICTGVMDVQPEIAGSIQPILPYANAQTADYCLRCDGHHVLNKETVIVGHGSGAAWVSVMLYERYKTPKMKILTNGEEPQFDETVSKLLDKYGITIDTQEILEVVGDKKSGTLEGFKLKDGSIETAQMSFVSLGMLVYNELAVSIGTEVDDRGFVITDEKGLTSVPNVYVAGDLRANKKKQIYTAWDTAVDSADAINGIIRKIRRES